MIIQTFYFLRLCTEYSTNEEAIVEGENKEGQVYFLSIPNCSSLHLPILTFFHPVCNALFICSPENRCPVRGDLKIVIPSEDQCLLVVLQQLGFYNMPDKKRMVTGSEVVN
jgi:hypothetical protein